MKAIWAEVRRTFRMTFNKETLGAMRQGRSHPGWMADPHLRRGFFVALPIVFGAMLLSLATGWVARSFALYLAVAIPAAILGNLVWFAVAAWSRSRSL